MIGQSISEQAGLFVIKLHLLINTLGILFLFLSGFSDLYVPVLLSFYTVIYGYIPLLLLAIYLAPKGTFIGPRNVNNRYYLKWFLINQAFLFLVIPLIIASAGIVRSLLQKQ